MGKLRQEGMGGEAGRGAGNLRPGAGRRELWDRSGEPVAALPPLGTWLASEMSRSNCGACAGI